jgi:hypothetical protein
MIPNVLMPEIEQIEYAELMVSIAMENEKGKKIYPAGGNVRFRDSMTLRNDQIWLWYNDESGSTKIIGRKRLRAIAGENI